MDLNCYYSFIKKKNIFPGLLTDAQLQVSLRNVLINLVKQSFQKCIYMIKLDSYHL